MTITIKVKAGRDKDSSYAQAIGSVEHVITDTERDSFKLSTDQLKDYVNRYFGKKPNDVFLHGPTPWHDLYKVYGWNPVKVHLAAKSTKILQITSEPVIIATKTLANKSSQTATFNAGISDSVTNTVSNTFIEGLLTFLQEHSPLCPGSELLAFTTSQAFSYSWSRLASDLVVSKPYSYRSAYFAGTHMKTRSNEQCRK